MLDVPRSVRSSTASKVGETPASPDGSVVVLTPDAGGGSLVPGPSVCPHAALSAANMIVQMMRLIPIVTPTSVEFWRWMKYDGIDKEVPWAPRCAAHQDIPRNRGTAVHRRSSGGQAQGRYLPFFFFAFFATVLASFSWKMDGSAHLAVACSFATTYRFSFFSKHNS
jgi:hypothetical protein